MKQRVGIAQALLNDPQLAVVDEPTVGLDPEERARFRELITGLAGDRIVLLSTHIVSDVETVAERVVMIANGALIADGDPETLARALDGQIWEGTVAADSVGLWRTRCFVTAAVRRRAGVALRVYTSEAPSGFAPAVPTLEEAYLVSIHANRNAA